jgi:NIMA (never in mitosis gene a)-related kinase
VVKIGDFGCARGVDISKIDNWSIDKGTFLYASPEQLKNEGYSSKCDVWAAGCIAYLLAFGIHPFLDSKPHNTLLLIKKHTEGKAMEIPAGTDPALAKLISLCLVYEDKERASWREIWLSRVFASKVADVRKFVDYLRNVSSVASWITK